VSGPDALRRGRAAAQLLSGRPERSAEAVARRLLAVQAQNLRAGRLAVRARTRGLTVSSVNAELESAAVVITWLQRGTLHLVCREDYAWLHGLAAPTLRVSNLRRLEQCGFRADTARTAAGLVVRWLEDGPLRRAEIGRRLETAGYRLEDQALVHLLFLATLDGRIVRGPFRGAEQAFVLVRDWLGDEPPALTGEARDGALGELALRYLAGHGPASAADLALWAGLPLRDAKAGLGRVADEIVDAGGDRVDLRSRGPIPRKLPPRLLPAFDPFLLGWQDRAFVVPAEHMGEIRLGGMIRPVVIVDGVGVGSWSAPRSGRRVAVAIEHWDEVGEEARAALAAEAADVARFETG
jgi:DNA glycosylase AlkZ-like